MLYEVFDCSVGLMCLILQENFGVFRVWRFGDLDGLKIYNIPLAMRIVKLQGLLYSRYITKRKEEKIWQLINR